MINKTILPILGVLVIGFVFVLASDAWNPAWDPFQAKGNLIERALTKTMSAKSLSASLLTKISADLEGEAGEQAMAIEIKLLQDISLKGEAQGSLNVNLETEGAVLTADLEDILANEGLYLKLNTLPAVLPLHLDLSSIKGKWLKIDLAMLKQAIAEPESEALSQEQKEQLFKEIKNVLQEHPIFIIKETREESYLVEIDKEALKELAPAFLEAMKKYIQEENLAEYQTAIDKAVNGFPQQVDDFWQKTGGIEIEVFLKNGYLSQIKWQKKIDIKDHLTPEIENKVSGGIIDVSLELSLDNFNKNFNIKAPASSTPLEEVLLPLLSSISGIMPGDFSQFDIPQLEDLENALGE